MTSSRGVRPGVRGSLLRMAWLACLLVSACVPSATHSARPAFEDALRVAVTGMGVPERIGPTVARIAAYRAKHGEWPGAMGTLPEANQEAFSVLFLLPEGADASLLVYFELRPFTPSTMRSGGEVRGVRGAAVIEPPTEDEELRYRVMLLPPRGTPDWDVAGAGPPSRP